MNINEAMKKATPGPYYPGSPIRSTDTIGINAARTMPDGSQHEETIAEVLPGCRKKQQKIDAALLAHCYNHLPKVLGALTKCEAALANLRELQQWDKQDGDHIDEAMDALVEAANQIAKASEVKV